MLTYEAVTDEIVVRVSPVYIDGQSDPLKRQFVFGYFVHIENGASQDVQLLRRKWVIRHGSGRVEEVDGEGVIGVQPVIGAGQTHTYNSYCVLQSFEGSMEGFYTMEWEGGRRFRATIPRFWLRAAAN
jgi:ApaG protein